MCHVMPSDGGKDPMRTRLINHRIQLAVATISLALLFSTTAGAHFLGGKFPHTRGNWLHIGYTQSGSYRTQVLNATASWHATPTCAVVFAEGYATSEADFYTVSSAETWWGLAVHHASNSSAVPCNGSGCSYAYVDLYLNSRTLASESDFIKQKVAAHEFGHALGLAHVDPSATYSSIMKQGSLSYNVPQSHDINDTNTLYPGCV
jgi:Matrixin